MTCSVPFFKMKKSCMTSTDFLVRDHGSLVARPGQNDWRWKRMKWMTNLSYVPQLALYVRSTAHCCNRLPLRWTLKASSADSAGVQSLYALDRQELIHQLLLWHAHLRLMVLRTSKPCHRYRTCSLPQNYAWLLRFWITCVACNLQIL